MQQMKKHIHGGDVYQNQNCIDFSANCNPLGIPESVKQAVIESLADISDYPRVGYAPLRRAIAVCEGVTPAQVVCSNGAAEMIYTLCRAADPKRALVTAPTFAEYEQALASVGCETEYFELSDQEGFMVGEGILKALHKDLDMVFLCNPNNPTGLLIDRDLIREILKVCKEKEILLVVDECFLDFIKEPEAHTLKDCLPDYENLFLLKAFTKRYAMAGIRLGYGLTANEKLLDRMERVVQPWNVSTIAQAAGIAALKETKYVEEGRQLVFREAKYLKKELQEMGIRVFPSEANYLFFTAASSFYEETRKRGILIRDCSNYQGLTKGYYRIAVRTHEENEKLIRVFREIICGKGEN